MNLEFIEAIDALAKEKHISKDVIFEAIESAVVSAYKKNFGTSHQNVRVEINQSTGEILAFMQMDVVEELEDEETQMTLEEAREIDDRYEIGDIIEFQVNPGDFGRIAAQTARQVVVQRIREAERGMVYDDFISRQGEIVTGKVERISNDTIFVNLGNTWGQPSELRCVVTVLQTACCCAAAGLTHLPSACGKGTGGLNPPRKPPCHRAATGGV